MRILFICSGNICRSPMAAVCMRHVAARRDLNDLTVDSAGTLGIDGASASAEAIEALGELGLDLGPHRSQGVNAGHMEQADLVIGMTHVHLMELATMFPRSRAPRFVLRAFEESANPHPDAPDLADPIGKSLGFYKKQVPVITRCVEHLALYLTRNV
jgi:protein-tyrosine phosphatase